MAAVLSSLIRRRWPLPVAALVAVVAVIGVALVAADEGDTIVVYNGRSHYGDEDVFEEFERETGIDVELRGGTAPELFERLRREGEDTPADVLITTDLANLWRAEEAGMLQPVTTATLEAQVPADLRDPDEQWWALSTRLRVPVVCTERVDAGAVDSFAAHDDPAFRGRVCLRTSDSEYNQSLVADMLAKRGPEATEALLQSWMDNDAQIIPSDGEMLALIADGQCDVGLSNHYYLGRILADDPDFPVAPVWADQDGRGTHVNFSGVGIVKEADNVDAARELLEYLASAEAQQLFAATNSEFPVNPAADLPGRIAQWRGFEVDPIDVDADAGLQAEAVALMNDVGWR